MIKTRKIIASLLACAMLCAYLPACSENGGNLSNPVAVNEDGDVDMDVALAYQTDVDALIEELESRPVDPTKPVSQNTNAKTMAVFNFLRENYGKNMITAQQMYSDDEYEDTVYYMLTDDLPAIKGFDMLQVTATGDTSQVDQAIEWHTKSGGLVTMTWHWFVPRDIDNPESSGVAFYTDEIVNFSLQNAVTPGTKEYEQVIHDIDEVAIQLQRLEAAGVPVIWRPLHEAAGGWFWWGKATRDETITGAYKKLWYMVFDRLENYHKLTNLIWVWNGQSSTLSVNPNTYDITGTDIYPNSETHSAQLQEYNNLAKMTEEGKMIALTECGYLPDIKDMLDKNAMWLYSMPWYGDFVYASAGSSGAPQLNLDGLPKINTERMSEEFIKELFASENVITWKELPDWEGTERNVPQATQTRIALANLNK